MTVRLDPKETKKVAKAIAKITKDIMMSNGYELDWDKKHAFKFASMVYAEVVAVYFSQRGQYELDQ